MGKTPLVSIFLGAFLLSMASTNTLANDDGKSAYETNCQACHADLEDTVGPSLKEIQSLYPANKQSDFLSWTKKPGKKRDNTIQMPAMSHLDDDTLIAIHEYVVSFTPAKKKKKSNKRHNFTFKAPPQTYPYYKRAYMPFASPASVGILLAPGFGLNWDAATCRLRYVFKSKQYFLGGENNKEKLESDIIYQENADALWSFAKGLTPKYKGYRLVDDLPVFIYQIGSVEVTESFQPGLTKNSIERRFTLSGHEQAVTMDLSSITKLKEGEFSISSSVGKIIDSKLTLSKNQAKSFAIKMKVSSLND